MTIPSILLVEDNPDDVELVLFALRSRGIKNEVIIARDGVEALDILLGKGGSQATNDRGPGLILLDLKLPRMDGFEVLTRLRSDPRASSIPIVILSSSQLASDVERGQELGASGYLAKDEDFGRFSLALERVGRHWLDPNPLWS